MLRRLRERRRQARLRKAAQRQAAGTAVKIAPSGAVPASEFAPVSNPGAPPIRGRTVELDRLAALRTSVVLVVGPPGVGKTRLLEVSAARSHPDTRTVARSEVVGLEHRSGALQTSLLRALGTALATYESTEDLGQRWGRVFKDALERAADATAKDLIRGAAAVMTGAVRERLGDAAADAIERVEAGLTEAMDEQLARRIEAEADPGAMRAFCGMAEQVQALVDGPVVLSLDRAERLADSDFRQLLDLLEILPAHVHVHVGHTRARPSDEARMTDLKIAGSGTSGALDVLELDGLDRDTIAEWMNDTGLEPDREVDGLAEVMRVTAGYPLHVDLAVRAIERGESLDQLIGDDALRLMIEQNYRALDGDDQRTLMLAAAFTDPPDEAIILGVLGVDAAEWAVRKRRLVDARFLVSTVYGTPWFHELGRRLLWDGVLSEDQRTTSAMSAVRTLLDHVGSAERIRLSYCIDLARLIPLSTESLDAHVGARNVLDLEPDHLAILAALEELTGTDNPSGLIGDVVSHARRRFPTQGDLYNAAEDLGERNLVVMAQNENEQALVPSWGSAEARALGLGRIVNVFGRAPIHEIASAVLQGVVLPHCGPFHVASLGSGYPTLSELSRQMRDRQYDREGNHVSVHDRPGIILRASLGSLEFGGAITFNDRPNRDEALVALTGEQAPGRVFGERWVQEVYSWPQPEPLAARRFIDAATLVTGIDFHAGSAVPNIPRLPTLDSHREEMDLRVRTWRTVAELSSDLEAAVLDLKKPRGIAFAVAKRGVFTAEILGRDDVVEVEMPEGPVFGLAARRALDRRIGLGAGERITRLEHRSESRAHHPVAALMQQTYKVMRTFNDAQGSSNRITVPFDADWIRQAVLSNLDRRQRDAQAFIDNGLFPAPPFPLGTEFLIVAVGAPGSGLFRGSRNASMVVGRRRVAGVNTVTVRILDELPEADHGWGVLEHEFGFHPNEEGASISMSVLSSGLEALLGHDSVTLDYDE